MKIEETYFDSYEDSDVLIYTLSNELGTKIELMNYGATLLKWWVNDAHGVSRNIILGFDTFDEYLNENAASTYYGMSIGRVAGRIKNGEFEIAGQTYHTPKNNNGHTLHGGNHGFNAMIWEAITLVKKDAVGVEFTLRSPDGENGFPGNLVVKATYLLNDKNELILQYSAKTDKDTLFVPTNHVYFNFNGDMNSNIANHKLKLKSDKVVAVDAECIPTGDFIEVSGTPFDFTEGAKFEQVFDGVHPQIQQANGLDHPFILNGETEQIIVSEEQSGIEMSVTTNEPCVVIYTSNGNNGNFDIAGQSAANHIGFTLETQQLPDAIHHSNFGDTILTTEKEYFGETIFKIS